MALLQRWHNPKLHPGRPQILRVRVLWNPKILLQQVMNSMALLVQQTIKLEGKKAIISTARRHGREASKLQHTNPNANKSIPCFDPRDQPVHKGGRRHTWRPWGKVRSLAEKLPAGVNSESPKQCSKSNWIFLSPGTPREDGEVVEEAMVLPILRLSPAFLMLLLLLPCPVFSPPIPPPPSLELVSRPTKPHSSSSWGSSSEFKLATLRKLNPTTKNNSTSHVLIATKIEYPSFLSLSPNTRSHDNSKKTQNTGIRVSVCNWN